ncbi:hypothetical protein MKQ68_05480 [Chitinophaga horti]|uniref:Uncharacterized protein n=1 Tax=Chitinophaga horti TaxID=2920382 RepID=A0ABY6J8D9_9BACT|nr:hypothetical protein [Chitinophaga horti]UYQ94541.1 hypothetical protein MKQ68_05480 [Chitinophaga horti]
MKYLLWLLLSGAVLQQPAPKHLLLDQYQQLLPGALCQDAKVHENDKQAKGRTTFLDRDFRTEYFAGAKSVRFYECEDRRFHLAMVSLEFNTPRELEMAMGAITASKRTAFRLPVRTRFVPKRLGNELLIIYSETFTDKRFQDLVNEP